MGSYDVVENGEVVGRVAKRVQRYNISPPTTVTTWSAWNAAGVALTKNASTRREALATITSQNDNPDQKENSMTTTDTTIVDESVAKAAADAATSAMENGASDDEMQRAAVEAAEEAVLTADLATKPKRARGTNLRKKLAGKGTRSVVTESWDRGLPVEQIATECGMTVERVHAFLDAARKGFDSPEALADSKAKVVAKPKAAKPKATSTRAPKQTVKIPDGFVTFRLSTSAFKAASENVDAKTSLGKALKACDAVRAAKKRPQSYFHMPIVSKADAATLADVLKTTAAEWKKDKTKSALSVKMVTQYAKVALDASK
jgi:hypothetical protein